MNIIGFNIHLFNSCFSFSDVTVKVTGRCFVLLAGLLLTRLTSVGTLAVHSLLHRISTRNWSRFSCFLFVPAKLLSDPTSAWFVQWRHSQCCCQRLVPSVATLSVLLPALGSFSGDTLSVATSAWFLQWRHCQCFYQRLIRSVAKLSQCCYQRLVRSVATLSQCCCQRLVRSVATPAQCCYQRLVPSMATLSHCCYQRLVRSVATPAHCCYQRLVPSVATPAHCCYHYL